MILKKDQMDSVLITGGAGYIGSVLAEMLLDKGYEVTVLDNLLYKQTSLLHLCDNKFFTFIKGDVTNKVQLQALVVTHDIIIPLAAIVGAPACDANKDLATSVNLHQIENIVDILETNQKLIMPNTNSQYGSSDKIITEESPFNPLSHYAKTKCEAEDYIIDWENGICLRLATVFGSSPRMRTVRDIARTFIHCIENYSKMNNQVYNVGLSDANLNKRELAEEIKKSFPNLVIIENEFGEDKDNRNYIVSNDKLEATGWRPIYSIYKFIKIRKYYGRRKNNMDKWLL